MNKTLDDEQLKALNLILKGENIHICGAAGTGKSYLISYIVEELEKKKLKVSITATTGVAANNLNNYHFKNNATTLHWWMGCGICKQTAEKEANNIRSLHNWISTNVLIIDEISMLDPELFEKIDKIARIVRKNPFPFGGIQMILCGDWFQLEPVRKKNEIQEKYK